MRALSTADLCLVLAVFTYCASYPTSAAPHRGEQFTYCQPDGTQFKIRLYGDELYAVAESLDGYTLMRDPVTRVFCYAKLATDGDSFISTGVPVQATAPTSLGLSPHIRLNPKAARARRKKTRVAMEIDAKGRPLKNGLAPQVALDDALLGSPSSAATGDRLGLVLLAQFPDRPNDVTISRQQVDAFCNDPNYSEFGNPTSVFGYFHNQSNGKLRYKNMVTAYFTTAYNRAYYTDPTIDRCIRARELVKEGIAALAATGFDFKRCDADGDGQLDAVNVLYAGANTNAWYEGLWPQMSMTTWPGLAEHGLDTFFRYQVANLGNSLSIGMFCHESGHVICGFPDLYSYDGSAANLGDYSLMAGGAALHPQAVDAYLKANVGWADVVDITATSHFRGALEVDKNTFYRYRNPDNPREYFILSIRGPYGYEGALGGATPVNPTSGLVIYHAIEPGSNTTSSIITGGAIDYSKPYELLVVEAKPGAGRPWYTAPSPGADDGYRAGHVDNASDETLPALKFWTNEGRTKSSGLNIHSISASGPTMTFVVGPGPVTETPVIGLTSSTLSPKCDSRTNARSQTFAVFNQGGSTLAYSITPNNSWITTSVISGTVTTEADQVTVNYGTDGLPPGHYTGKITVTDNTTYAARQIAVGLTVSPNPAISVTPSTITEELAPDVAVTKTVEIGNSGGGTLFYEVSSNVPWLILSHTTGNASLEADRVTLTIDSTGFTRGNSYTGAVVISDRDRIAQSRTVTVNICTPQAEFAYVNDVSVTEGDAGTTTAMFSVSLSQAAGSDITIHYATADGTATAADNDYLSKAGSIIFSPGQRSKQIPVIVNGDLSGENDEAFRLRLTGVSANARVGDGEGVCVIADDDRVSIAGDDERNSSGGCNAGGQGDATWLAVVVLLAALTSAFRKARVHHSRRI